MNAKHPFAIVGLAAALLVGCGAEETTQQLSVERRFSIGMKKFQNQEYLDAIEDFKIVTLQFQGSTLADDAQFYLGESRYLREEFILAAYEYDLLMRTMPTSEYVPRARFRKAMCYYNLSPESYRDQDYTRKAIDEFQAFLEYNPTDSLASDAETRIDELNRKLAKKVFENGMIYMKMEYYRSATVTFDDVLEKYHDSPYAEPALLRKTEALLRRKRYLEAKQEIEKFLEKFPNSSFKEEAERMRDEISLKLAEPPSKDPKLPFHAPTSARNSSMSGNE